MGHPGRKCVLNLLGVASRQAVLGFQDGDRAGLHVILRERFDLLDELRPACSGLPGAQLFPDGRVGPVPGLELTWTCRRRVGIGGTADNGRLGPLPGIIAGIGWRVEVVLACDPDHRKQRVPPGVGQCRPHPAGRRGLGQLADRPMR